MLPLRAASVLAMVLLAVPAPVPATASLRPVHPAPSRHLPVYRIPLRVHLGRSGRSARQFLPMLEEINEIWLLQAGICFEMEAVSTGERNPRGLDLWFEPMLPEQRRLNGYYRNDHAMYVRDTPRLGPALHPARYPAARTAAHELGHSLGLPHRQDSDDNLMRSKTYGWRLNDREIALARQTAKAKALPDHSEARCGAVRIR